MSNPNTVSLGNIKGQWLLGVTLSPASVAPNTSNEQTFTVSGLLLGDMIDVNKPTTQGGLSVGNSRCSANNTLAIEFVNSTAATITPTASEVYLLEVTRAENLNASSQPTMSSIVS